MARNPLLEKNRELTGIIASMTAMVKDLKDEKEELINEIEAIVEEHDIKMATLLDAHNKEVEQLKNKLKESEEENRKLQAENASLRKNVKTSELGAPDVAEQLSLMQATPSQLTKIFGVEMVSKNDRLDRSKSPPKPEKPEFDTDYILYTDGACLGNGRPGLGYGGWGYVILDNTNPNEAPLEAAGNAGPNTTNQVMELTAVLQGLKELVLVADEDATITLCSDSKYAIDGITKWSINWQKNGWVNSKGDPVANMDLWKEILALLEKSGLNVEFKWVKGHDSNHYNSVCDLLATAAAADRAQECGCHDFDDEIPTY